MLCTAFTDQQDPAFDGQAACSAATYGTEALQKILINMFSYVIKSSSINNLLSLTGDTVQVVYRNGVDTTPLFAATGYYYNGFTGFRI